MRWMTGDIRIPTYRSRWVEGTKSERYEPAFMDLTPNCFPVTACELRNP